MGSTLGRRNDVNEGLQSGVIARPPTECYINLAVSLNLARFHVALFIEHGYGFGEGCCAAQAPSVRYRIVVRQVIDKLDNSAIELEVANNGFTSALVINLKS